MPPPHSPHPYSITYTRPRHDTRTHTTTPPQNLQSYTQTLTSFLGAAPNSREYRLLAESTRQSCYSRYSEPPESPRPVRSPRPAQTRPLGPLPRRGPGSASSQNPPKRNLRDTTCRQPGARSTDSDRSACPLRPRAQVLPEGPAARPNFRSELGLSFLCWG